MTRELLERILGSAHGVVRKDGGFDVAEDHQLHVYLGQPGQAMVVSEVERCVLEGDVVCLKTREKQTMLWVEYPAVHALSVRPPRTETGRKAGFG